MLRKKFKISSKTRVEQVLKKGLKIPWRFGQLRYLKNKCDFPRFCVIVSGKISRKAVERNFIRRRIYEAIPSSLLHFQKTCYDVVVLVSRKIINAAWSDIKKETFNCLNNLNKL
ncbi:ribonuclease P protein component [Candidatus Peregrinibacteria bacterium]|nr:ribonuclease P protein component [Candidatus Peregrinibacteria bacterium]